VLTPRTPHPLPSFPPRRSSDLSTTSRSSSSPLRCATEPSPGSQLEGGLQATREHRAGRREIASERRQRLDLGRIAEQVSREAQRSEEHTSELQSIAYLVCRLLL